MARSTSGPASDRGCLAPGSGTWEWARGKCDACHWRWCAYTTHLCVCWPIQRLNSLRDLGLPDMEKSPQCKRMSPSGMGPKSFCLQGAGAEEDLAALSWRGERRSADALQGESSRTCCGYRRESPFSATYRPPNHAALAPRRPAPPPALVNWLSPPRKHLPQLPQAPPEQPSRAHAYGCKGQGRG